MDLGIASSLTRWLDVLGWFCDLSLFPHILQCKWFVAQSVLLNLRIWCVLCLFLKIFFHSYTSMIFFDLPPPPVSCYHFPPKSLPYKDTFLLWCSFIYYRCLHAHVFWVIYLKRDNLVVTVPLSNMTSLPAPLMAYRYGTLWAPPPSVHNGLLMAAVRSSLQQSSCPEDDVSQRSFTSSGSTFFFFFSFCFLDRWYSLSLGGEW